MLQRFIIYLLFISFIHGQQIIPSVAFLQNVDGGNFIVDSKITTIFIEKDSPEVLALAHYLGELFQVEISQEEKARSIKLSCENGDWSDESYSIICRESSLELQAKSYRGLVWAVQTLLQLSPPEILERKGSMQEKFIIPALEIHDSPKYAYRGMHLDVSRNFFTVAEVKKFIDYMAMHKLNTLHWHLTDDQGWRIEIKKYPRLTEVGATRRQTPKLGNRNQGDSKIYGPYFYTQSEIREVVAYAKKFGIEIIPEIDLPGHAQAALAAYNNLGCTNGPYETWTKWGVSNEVFCVGNDDTIAFLKDVFAEVAELFPGKYVHIGGDECIKTRWAKCKKCTSRLQQVGAENFHQLQTWVIREMQTYLESKGKKIIGWDEILCSTLPKSATIMSWQGVAPGIKASQENYQVIMTPNSYLYFDYAQSKKSTEPESFGGYVGLENVYGFDVSCNLEEKFSKNIIGAQANCWSEFFHDFARLEYAILPRMAALAEITWHAPKLSQRDINVFQNRLLNNYKRYNAMKANFRFAAPQFPSEILFRDKYVLTMPEMVKNIKLKYIRDEKEYCYEKPLEFNKDEKIQYYLELADGRKSQVETIFFRKVAAHKAENVSGKGVIGLQRKMVRGRFFSCKNINVNSVNDKVKIDIGALSIYKEGIYPKNNYGIEFNGYFVASKAGCYNFSLRSDDGAKLWVADLNKTLIDNDGLHSDAEEKSGMIFLEAGLHIFKMRWFDAGGGKSLKLTVQFENEKERNVEREDFRFYK